MKYRILALFLPFLAMAQQRSNIFEAIPTTTDTATGEVRLLELRANGASYFSFKAPDVLAGNVSVVPFLSLPGSTQCVTLSSTGQLATTPCASGSDIGLAVTRSSATQIGIASGIARSGNVATSFSAATATLGGTSSTGTAYVYVSGGTLFVGHNTAATITCSACTTATSIAAFPSGSIPIATATFTGNIWDVSGITDVRAALGTTPVIGGSGITVTQSSGVYTVAATGSSTPACASNQVVPISLEPNADFQTGGQLQFTALANRVYAFVLPCTGSPARFGFSVETASGTCSGTCGMAVAFYDDSGSRLANATVATSGGSPNINTTGFKSLTISSPPTLTGGVRYYVAISTDSTALKLLAPNSWTTCSNRNAMATYCATAANSSTGSGGSIASPATLGTLTPTDGASAASMWPYLYLRF